MNPPDLQNSNIQNVRKAVQLLRLNLSDEEINQLAAGQAVLIKDKGLTEVGLALVRAEAIAEALAIIEPESLTVPDWNQEGFIYFCWKDASGRRQCSCINPFQIQIFSAKSVW